MNSKGIYRLCLSKHGLINAIMQSLFGCTLLYSAGEKFGAQIVMQTAVFEAQTFFSFEEKVCVNKVASIYRETNLEHHVSVGKYKNTAMLLAQLIVDKIGFIEECGRQNDIDDKVKNAIIDSEKKALLSLKERFNQIKSEKER